MKKNTINLEVKTTDNVTEVNLNKKAIDELFMNKLTINGEQQKDSPRKVTTVLNEKKLDLNCKYIEDELIVEAYKNNFIVPVKDKNVQVVYAKSGRVLSACIYVDSKLEFAGMTMQAIFLIVEAAFGVSKLVTDKLYIKSNANRKKIIKKTEKPVITENVVS